MEFQEIPPNNDDPLNEAPVEEKPASVSGDEMARMRLEEVEKSEIKPEKIEAKKDDPLAVYLKEYGAAERKQAELDREKRLEELRREILGK
jgi:hypothetical protein